MNDDTVERLMGLAWDWTVRRIDADLVDNPGIWALADAARDALKAALTDALNAAAPQSVAIPPQAQAAEALRELVAAIDEDERIPRPADEWITHGHTRPGIWDADNIRSGKANKPCRVCAAWKVARAIASTVVANASDSSDGGTVRDSSDERPPRIPTVAMLDAAERAYPETLCSEQAATWCLMWDEWYDTWTKNQTEAKP